MPLVLSGTSGISTNGTNWALQPQNNGALRQPNLPHARVSRNAGDIAYNTVITYNYTDEDVYGMHNAANGRFTAPVAGRYLHAHGMFTANGYSCWLKWRVNGTTIASTYTSLTSGYTSVAGSVVLTLNANDYVELWIDSGTSNYRVYGGDRIQCWSTFTYLG